MASAAAAAGGAYPLLANRDGTGREGTGYWEPTGEEEALAAADGAADARPPPLYRTFKVKDSLLLPYRLLNLARLLLIINFFAWRIKHRDSDSMVLWWTTVVGDFWFGLSWLLNQASKMNPIKRVPDLALLHRHVDDGRHLPAVDVFINTVDPVDEPVLCTMNSVLSVLATDYPAGRHATYFSDDGASLVHYEALRETARFAALWAPFCRKHRVEPRAPESYFAAAKAVEGPYAGDAPGQFIGDRRRVRREYEEFKARVAALFVDVPRRSEVFGRGEDGKGGGERATYMADGRQWPGAWVEPAENHRKGQHAAVVEVILNHPGDEPQLGTPASSEDDGPLDLSAVDVRLPMLVYIAREKRPGYDHQKKAGAMNVQLRVSALLTNAPFIINLDGDHYVHNSAAFHAAMCFFLDARRGEDTAFVQFPQRFDGVDPGDRYCNHNRVFFDATLLGLNGLQGPSYVGTGCMFRRAALYGADPPPKPAAVDSTSPCRRFGTSMPFVNSVPLAATTNQARPPASPRRVRAELDFVSTCAYEDGTEWGRGVGWVYNIATEDVVTGFRLHRKGWRSAYCATAPDAFRGTAPINLTERLYQILRWSGGSLDMFLSRNCPLLAGRRLHPMQRVAYTNMTVYPVCAAFIFAFDLLPLMWLFLGGREFYVQKPFATYAEYLFAGIVLMELSGMLEVKWAGLSVRDWVRNEQFYMIGATGVYPAAVLHSLLRLAGLNGLPFKLTAKQPAGGAVIMREPFADMYHVQWAPLLAPTLLVMAVNAAAIGAVAGKAVAFGWTAAEVAGASGGLLFNVWVLLLLYPFGLGVMGRWSKRPYLFFVLLLAVLLAVAALYLAVLAAFPHGTVVPPTFRLVRRVLHAVSVSLSPGRWRT